MPDDIRIRRLRPGDEALLLAADVFDHPVIPEQAAAFLAEPGHEILLAFAGDEAVGMVTATVLLHPDQQPLLFINEVGVEEAWQQRGIATVLVERMLEIGRERGCKGVWLATEVDNVAARALYRRTGARETGGIVVYDWDGAMDDQHPDA